MASLDEIHDFLGLIKEAYKEVRPSLQVSVGLSPLRMLVSLGDEDVGIFHFTNEESWIRVDTLSSKEQDAVEVVKSAQGKDRLEQVVKGT